MIRRCTAILLLLLLLVTGLALACGGPRIPPSDEVTTRMNARDEEALDDASARHDAGAAPPARSGQP